MPHKLARIVLACAAAMVAAACARADAPEPVVAYADSAAGAEADSAAGAGFLDPNLVTVAALTGLPGMSDSVALAVVAGGPTQAWSRSTGCWRGT